MMVFSLVRMRGTTTSWILLAVSSWPHIQAPQHEGLPNNIGAPAAKAQKQSSEAASASGRCQGDPSQLQACLTCRGLGGASSSPLQKILRKSLRSEMKTSISDLQQHAPWPNKLKGGCTTLALNARSTEEPHSSTNDKKRPSAAVQMLTIYLSLSSSCSSSLSLSCSVLNHLESPTVSLLLCFEPSGVPKNAPGATKLIIMDFHAKTTNTTLSLEDLKYHGFRRSHSICGSGPSGLV